MRPDQKLLRARAALVTNHPFFGCLALNLALRPSADAATMSTDGRELVYSPAYIDSLNDRELRGVLAHEVMHCAAQHMTRRGARDPKRWNLACDYAINPDVTRAGFVLPVGAALDPRFDGMGAEAIYAALERDDERQGKPQGKPADGDQNGDGVGGVRDAAAPHEPAKAQETAANWKALTAQALAVAKAQNAGTLPGFLERLAAENAAARIDWRSALRRFVDSAARVDYTWTRPNRRFIGAGFYMPGIQPDGLTRLVTIVDTSGSIGPKDLEAFRAEIAAAMDDGAADALTVVYTDTAVRGVQEFTRGDEIALRPNGGGGTDFRAVMRDLPTLAPDASAVIFLTDLCTNDFGDEPPAPVLWVATGNAPAAPYGETIRLQ